MLGRLLVGITIITHVLYHLEIDGMVGYPHTTILLCCGSGISQPSFSIAPSICISLLIDILRIKRLPYKGIWMKTR
jgi:hypothetical protein